MTQAKCCAQTRARIGFRSGKPLSTRVQAGALASKITSAGVWAAALVFAVIVQMSPLHAETKSKDCLTNAELVNSARLAGLAACEFSGALYLLYSITNDPPLDHPVRDHAQFSATLAAFQSLRRQVQVERAASVVLESDLHFGILLMLANRYGPHWQPEPARIAARQTTLLALYRENASEDALVAFEKSVPLLGISRDEHEIPASEAMCFWANDLPTLSAQTVLSSEQYLSCVNRETYAAFDR